MSMSKALSKQASRSMNSGNLVANPKISKPAMAAIQTEGSAHITIPQKYFSFSTAPVNADGEASKKCTTSADACRTPTPEMRFRKRNDFFIRRHLVRDHIIKAQHFDIRIAAIRTTETLKDAVKKHNMIKEEATFWGPFAAGTSLYASFLRGDERVKAEVATNNTEYPWDHEDDTSPINTTYCEGFAVGEIRGFANFDQIRALRAPEVAEGEEADVDPSQLPSLIPPGDGVMKVTKFLYGTDKPFTSTLPSSGNARDDWQRLYDQSEQTQSFIYFNTSVDPENRHSAFFPNGELRPVSDLTLDTESIDFCGGVLIQVLGGPANPVVAERILADRPQAVLRAKDAAMKKAVLISEVDADVRGLSVTEPDSFMKSALDEIAHLEEETDDAYVKRVQLQELQEKVKTLDMPVIMKKRGVAAYVAALLDMEVEALGQSPSYQIGNPSKEFDYEALENRLIQVSKLPDGVTEDSLQPQDKYDCKHWQYRPVAFFCRCTQTKPEDQLKQLPNELLYDLVEDGGAEFTCEYCNTHTVIPLEKIHQALNVRNTSASK